MNDERFEQDLAVVLREIAGKEAPVSLRYRVADVTQQAPARRLWFSPPLRLAAAAVAVVAIAALAIIFVPRELIGPSPSGSPELSTTPAVTASPAPSASEEATPTLEPSATPVPTIAPPVAWTGLDWSAGVIPFAPDTSFLTDIVAWHGGYVGVGGAVPRSAQTGQGGAIFASADGLHWTMADQVKLPQDWYFERLVPVGDGLLAISAVRGYDCPATVSPCPPADFDFSPRLWYSPDGRTWSQVDSPSWRVVGARTGLINVVSGPAGVLALFYDGSVAHTSDGRSWQSVSALPASASAIVKNAAAFAGGFVVVGRDGERDVMSEAGPQPAPSQGRPAAWISADGVTWTEAELDGTTVQGGELREVAAGADGFFAAGIGEAVDTQAHPLTHGWASVDGTTWTMVGRLGEDLPLFGGSLVAQGFVVGDGSNMLIFGPESATSAAVVAHASTNGFSWQLLSFSGASTDFMTGWSDESSGQGVRYLTGATVVPDGVIANVYNGEAELWFGAAAPQGTSSD